MSTNDSANIHKGHRQKVKQRYYETGLDSMPDHNVLEMLLFFGIPYKDTNEIAHELINRFGSFSAVLRTDVNALKKVKGMTDNAACLISMLLPIYKRYASEMASKMPQMFSVEEIVEHMKPKLIDTSYERVFVLCFDGCHNLITTRQLTEGGLTSAKFDLRSVASVALETKTTDMILVHNHPNGIALPSTEDIVATERVKNLLNSLGVNLIDHIIIADEDYCALSQVPKCKYLFYDIQKIQGLINDDTDNTD
ncbi:MAG: hypothetical protein NC122_00470 [Faecalibacterium sp.]|nr:hypothetical protein [Ruminococcus sp.]MCM1392341.1 hypothetical protein [Ruminococcus sp.]MCM1484663.1 hypothetical protein [Faecalibacterium sp.]